MSSAPITQYNASAPPNTAGSSDGQASGSGPPQHKRVYQACIPCRRRKVKCDLGSVDNPGDPPCVRCRRESKECYFSATRRKRKAADGADGSADGNELDDDYLIRNGRKRLQSDAGSDTPGAFRHGLSGGVASSIGRYMDEVPMTPGGNVGRTVPLKRPNGTNDDNHNVHMENYEAQEVMRREVYGPHDALDLLYKAATNSPGHQRDKSDARSPVNGMKSPEQQRIPPRSQSQTFRTPQMAHMAPADVRRDTRIDPNLTASNPGAQRTDRTHELGYKEAIKAWSRFRFVRAGWFTPTEAIEYLEYYYEFLSPLTPISPPTFSKPESHPTLLAEEPILSVTLLTIASRYKRMAGPGGHCRSYAIHEQLWTYLRGMIERCLWGQEAFGGGFCGSGAIEGETSSSTAPWRGLRKGSLRTLGTVESLMILTEWHPRALHFPPADATDELMLPSYDGSDNYSTDEEGNRRPSGGVGGKRIESWLEPAWRSDRMCWMLLSNAMGLSYELGVFDDTNELLATGDETARPEYAEEAYRLRASRIKKLLLIYVTQLAGRLGWTNMVPEHLRNDNGIMEHRRTRTSVDGNTPGTSTTSISNAFNYIPDLELDDQIIHCWAGITTAMRTGNERIFKSRKHTTDIIQSGKYITLLKEFQPMLKNWWQTFEGFRLPQYIRHILTIEYEYVRIYINSLSLQAVVERSSGATSNSGGQANGNAVLSPETQNFYGKMPLAKLGGFGPEDQIYVKEVVDGSRNLLKTVVDGLLPGGYLKHAPVRTYFRIISGAMFLLKTFALGASKNDVELSIALMDRAVHALRTCVVDDVHLGTRFADLLETLTSRLRNRFMHAPGAGTAAPSARVSPQPSTSGQQQGVAQGQDGGAPGRGSRSNWGAGTPGVGNGFQDQMSGLDSGISATAFDMTSGASGSNTFFPGVAFNGNEGAVFNMEAFGGGNEWSNDMWYLPPGAAFFANNDQAITQTAEGVNVGGIDLLDYMTMDSGFANSMDGSNNMGF